VEERRLLRGGESGSDSESDSESESESDESDESESEESDAEDSASSISRRCSIMSLGAFCK